MNIIWTIASRKNKYPEDVKFELKREDGKTCYIPANIHNSDNLEKVENQIHRMVSDFFTTLKSIESGG